MKRVSGFYSIYMELLETLMSLSSKDVKVSYGCSVTNYIKQNSILKIKNVSVTAGASRSSIDRVTRCCI